MSRSEENIRSLKGGGILIIRWVGGGEGRGGEGRGGEGRGGEGRGGGGEGRGGGGEGRGEEWGGGWGLPSIFLALGGILKIEIGWPIFEKQFDRTCSMLSQMHIQNINRNLFFRHVDEVLFKDRNKISPAPLSDYKRIVDDYGYQVGDIKSSCLKEI